MSFLPANLSFVAKQVSNYSRNRFRLETNSTKNTVTAGDVITVNLPESALLDMKSFRWVFKASSAAKSSTNLSLFPSMMQSLIERVEIYINGVQIQNGCAQYNTLCQVLKIGRCNHDRNDSIENCLSKSHVTDEPNSASALNPDSVSCVIDKWYGFLGETSTRFLDTSLLGQIQVRLTLATEKVMIPYYKADSKGFDLSGAFPVADLNYQLEKMYFTIDSLSVDPMYSMALRDQLAKNEFIPINYKEYYTYTLGGQVSDSYQNRFALSSGSIDKIYGITRPNTYNSGGKAIGLSGEEAFSAGQDAHIAAYFAFASLSQGTYSNEADDLRYQWSINNVAHPQYRAQLIEACADLAYGNDKCGDYSAGIMPTSLANFKQTKCVIPLVLNHPETPISVMSGYNSRGINSMMVLDVDGLLNAKATNGYESMVIVETTAQIRASSGKSLATSK